MKKFAYSLLCLALCAVMLLCSSCTPKDEPEEEIYDLVLVYSEGDRRVEKVSSKSILKVTDAEDGDFYDFAGWYLDEELTQPYTPQIPNSNILLYAKWKLNDAGAVNELTKTYIKSLITVRADCYDTLYSRTPSDSFSGSGVIFDSGDGHTYYCLTNNHVVIHDFPKILYTVTDFLGNEYSQTDLVGADPEYDLAMLSFHDIFLEGLTVAPLGEKNPEVGSRIYSLGQPKGQSNAITVGRVSTYKSVTLNGNESTSNVTFPTITHSSWIASGSSGGPVFDSNLHIVGINYADGVDDDGEFLCGFAVPIEKVLEFIEKTLIK